MGLKYANVDFKLLLRKGVFPYEYLDSFEKFNDPALPNRDAFFSTLRGEECSVEDFDYAKRVWAAFECHTLEDYLKLYLASDVCQLADVFENFRHNCFQNYKLDPAYFVSAPQLAWNAMFKFLDLKLELISDPEMYRMIQPNIRGGICHASGRYARANNKYMGALYRPDEPESFIMYIDATNLYGWAMSQTLPYIEFDWLSNAQLREAEAALTSDDWLVTVRFLDSQGRYLREHRRVLLADANGQAVPPVRDDIKPFTAYIFEVDLEYPNAILDRDDDYPLAPELMQIKTEMLSEKQMRLRRMYYSDSDPSSRKLICSLLPKKHYVVFSETLKFYIERGMKVTKLHRAIRFESKEMLTDYIQLNTTQRSAAGKDECKRNFFKLMNVAPYGKTIENVDKRTSIKILTDMNKARSIAEKPQCTNFRLFNPNLVAVERRKLNQVISKPFQLGFAVLEYSKLHMYRTYATLKDWYGPRMRMLYTDTDSLIMQFFTNDFYKEILDVPQLRRLFDFSEIPANHPSCLGTPDDTNKGKVGFFKDETKGNPITEFVALKPKMYSFKVCECQEFGSNAQPRVWNKQVGKGIARATLKKTTHQQYLNMFQERHTTKLTNKRIASKLHQVLLIISFNFTNVIIILIKLKVYSLAVEKRGLSAYDDKRVLLANLDNGEPNPNTHAYGHYSLENELRVHDAEEQPEAGNDLQIESREKIEEARLQRKHSLAVKRARRTQPEDISENDEAEVQGDDLIQAQRAAVARPPPSVRINTVIERICARDHLERPTSPPLRMPPPPSPQRAAKVVLNNLIA